MANSKLLRKALWANIAFAEIGALAAIFLSGKWTIIDELADGQTLLLGIELLILAGLSAYAVMRKVISKPLIWLVITLNLLLAVFLLSRLTDAAISSAAMELIVVDLVGVFTLVFFQIKGIRAYSRQLHPALPA